jgi:hypothetical protein
MTMIRSLRWLSPILIVLALSLSSFAQIGISITIGPPALPVYTQPVCPAPGYMWTPGYWAYGPGGYYWVPGTWVMAPTPGLLWTPGYWGFVNGAYLWHGGYWGPHIGFYGGINYGFGYGGVGYEGGYWNGGRFFYNRSVTNVNVTNVTNVYNKTVINNTTVNNVSYNGGAGGVTARPTATELAAEREQHTPPTAMQTRQVEAARNNPASFASANHGRPAIAATAKPGEFSGRGVVAARSAGAPYNAGANRPETTRNVPRPGASGMNNNNSRPGSVANNQAPRPGNNVPRPGNNVPRPPASQTGAARPGANNANNASRPENSPRTQNAGYSGGERNVGRPQGQNRPQNAPRSENSSRPQNEGRQQGSSHSQNAPHSEREGGDRPR